DLTEVGFCPLARPAPIRHSDPRAAVFRSTRQRNLSSVGVENQTNLEAGGMLRNEHAFGAHVVASQFAQRVGHKFCSILISPGHTYIGVVEGLGDACGE